MDKFKFSHYEIECFGNNEWSFLECCKTLEEAKKLKQHLETLDIDTIYRIVELQKRVVEG